MVLARELTDLSLMQIGEGLGGRQHSTIIAGSQKMTQVAAGDGQVADLMNEARRKLM